MYGRMVKIYGMVNIHTEDMTNMEIDQNKTCQLLGQMKTGPSSNMEMESHILVLIYFMKGGTVKFYLSLSVKTSSS